MGFICSPCLQRCAKELNRLPNTVPLLPEIDGVLVTQVMPKSPAAEAGLKQGDVIVEFENKSVTHTDQLQELVARSKIGQALTLTVQRGHQIEQFSIQPKELQDAARS